MKNKFNIGDKVLIKGEDGIVDHIISGIVCFDDCIKYMVGRTSFGEAMQNPLVKEEKLEILNKESLDKRLEKRTKKLKAQYYQLIDAITNK